MIVEDLIQEIVQPQMGKNRFRLNLDKNKWFYLLDLSDSRNPPSLIFSELVLSHVTGAEFRVL